MPAFSRTLVACAVVAVGLSAAACSSGGGSHANGPTTTPSHTSGAPAGSSQTAQQELVAAASDAQQMRSAVETISESTASAGTTTTGTVKIQLKPTLKMSANINTSASGQAMRVKMILTGTTMYLSEPALTKSLGKPWVKLNLKSLGSQGASIAQLLHSLQSNDFANQAELLTVAKNARVVGTQTLGGVSTTEYAGSFTTDAAMKALPASFRKLFSSVLKQMGSPTISFHEWIDAQHHMRKLVETETVGGQTVTTTVTISAINEPVHIAVPPASKTATPPGL